METAKINGARDLLILNWFEESVAGRQGKGRQLDFRHGRHLDAPGPFNGQNDIALRASTSNLIITFSFPPKLAFPKGFLLNRPISLY